VECTFALGAEMLVLGGVAASPAEARPILEQAIASGRAASVMERMIAAHGGDPRVVSDPSLLAVAESVIDVRAERSGFVTRIDALELGLSAIELGAGRTRADQAVDHGVGIDLRKKPGDPVAQGDVLAVVRARDELRAPLARISAAFTIGPTAPPDLPLVIGRIDAASAE
jgi:pyrimidine-nucleoside phosphorylase